MSAGKGSKPRPVDGDKYRANYAAIFRPVVAADYVRRTQYIAHLASIPSEDLVNMIDVDKLHAAFTPSTEN